VRFTVYGDAKSAGSKRAFRHLNTGRVIVTETVRGSKSWQGSVAAAGAEAHRGPLLDGPLRVVFTFYRPRPRSHYGTGRNADTVKPSAPRFPATRPDVLKLARGVEDALTGVVWADDARIVTEELRKRWGSPARVEVEVEEERERRVRAGEGP
jgi:Holliday junction resolvase RusA-like endonuclease